MEKRPEIRNNIRRLRFERGEMTQQELADRAGVTRQTIIALEAGKYTPSLMLGFKISRVFGVKVEEVFEYLEWGDGSTKTRSVEGHEEQGAV